MIDNIILVVVYNLFCITKSIQDYLYYYCIVFINKIFSFIKKNFTFCYYLQMDNVYIHGRKGTLHFIRFPTSHMGKFLELARSKGMANLVTTVCATGGGAYKFEEEFKRVSTLILLFYKHYT